MSNDEPGIIHFVGTLACSHSWLSSHIPVSISCLRMYATDVFFHFPVANCNYFISLSITPIPLPLSTALRFHQFAIIIENG